MSRAHANPMQTRTGKTRLGPLNYAQLEELLNKESRPKVQAKIRRRMSQMTPPSICTSETANDAV